MAKADFSKAKRAFPSTQMTEADWIEVFDRQPDIMWQILADVYNVVRDEQDRENGIRRMGRRPVRAAGSMEELLKTVMPEQWTNDPFPVALNKLLAGRSQVQFAQRANISQSTLSRLILGEQKPTLAFIENVATAAKVAPFYFPEYRALFVSQMVERALTAYPHLGVTAMKRYRRALDD